ncbi:uncharacterized protein LOC143448259 isoform X1 [Clavelina lepadiformis]|uniref:uncharacterized protein LOC143448259 isoform X1 n=1 Tax=Clavelina lepadiformis TaxID=159417 RepID=UPI0040432A56
MPLNILKKKPRPKLLSVRISTFDADMEFSVNYFTKPKHVFDLVCHTIGLRETWYFGLTCSFSDGSSGWVKLDKKILDQNLPINDDGFILFKFLAKFYPEAVEEDLIQEVTRHLFYLQFQHLILNEELHCSPEASILLASYAVQAKYGDYDPDVHQPGFLANEVLLPQSVIDQFQSVTGQMWENQITEWYANHHGLTRDEAQLEYLKIVQDLEMSGVNYFEIKDINGCDMWLGIDAKSVSLYPKGDKLQQTKSYQWSELADMSYKGNNFSIKLTPKIIAGGTLGRRRLNLAASVSNLHAQSEELHFVTDNPDTNKLILELCKGNHDLYMKKRKVDSMEIQHMKTQAKEERERKLAERERFRKERESRIQIQQEKKELEEKLKPLQEENKAAADALRRSEETAELLSEKAKLAEEEAKLLRIKVSNAENEIQRLKMDNNQFQEANHLLKQNLLKVTQQLSEQSRAKSLEMENLRNELHATKAALSEANRKINRMNNSNMHHSPSTSGSTPGTSYLPVNQSHSQVMAVHNLSQNGTNQAGPSPTVSGTSNNQKSMLFHLYPSSKNASTASDGTNQVDRNSHEFSNSGGSIADMQQLSQEIEKERVEYQVKSRNIEQQLQTLRSEIEVLKVDDDMLFVDQIPPNNHHPDQTYAIHNEGQQRPHHYNGV